MSKRTDAMKRKAKQMAKYRSLVIFGTFVFGAVATPSTDPFSMLAVATVTALSTIAPAQAADVIKVGTIFPKASPWGHVYETWAQAVKAKFPQGKVVGVEKLSATATGAVFVPPTRTFTVAVSVPPCPSLTVYLNRVVLW